VQTIYYIDRYGNIDRTGFRYKKTPAVKIYPVTLTNLTGVYGNFERDSNGDGLADGWVITGASGTIVSGIIGDNAQQFSGDNTGGSSTLFSAIFRRIYPKESGPTYFGSFYYKYTDVDANTWGVKFVLYQYTSEGTYISGISTPEAERTTAWNYYSAVFSVDSSTDYCIFRVEQPIATGYQDTVIVDAVALYDLKAMGTLPPPLQELYSVTYWYELSEEQLASLLPFCPGVCSLGFAWESDV